MGGLERNTYSLAMAIKEEGYDVTLFTGTLAKTIEPLPFQVIRSKSKLQLASYISKNDYVLINGGLSLKVCLPAFLRGRKYGVIYQMSSIYLRQGTGVFNRISNDIRRFFADYAVANICVSNYAATLLNLWRTKVFVLPNPIDKELEIFAQNGSTKSLKEYDILFAGRLIAGKGIFLLIDALSKLKPREFIVSYAGEGDEEQELKAYAKEKSIKVNFLGRLEKHHLMDVYRKAKVLVVPSTTHIEGSPLVIAEALTMGVPVIASDQPAMIEAVGSSGLIFKSFDSDDLSDKILFLFDNYGHLKQLTENCKERAIEFSSKNYRRKLREILLVFNKNESS